FVVVSLPGLEDLRRLNKVFDLHLFELAGSKDKVAGRYLVSKSLADLRDSKGQLSVRAVEDVFEIDEDSLRSLRPQVSKPGLIFNRANCSPEHQVELTRLGKIRRAAFGTFCQSLADFFFCR